ncbi:hypothetical protein BDN70DRAFT_873597 [Pholiota conissans]|uniref:Uncharacterized protein n=1 Tax=Pholiota conissans TaxID=109636 RepID=A0A9P5Z8R3_9AGAR|nr:hypothetical protein BDN70DRAFT_873597 [Pholiota conissans]
MPSTFEECMRRGYLVRLFLTVIRHIGDDQKEISNNLMAMSHRLWKRLKTFLDSTRKPTPILQTSERAYNINISTLSR